ncbi:MAG: pyridoxal phosphate-dependent aminotransferase, partial [Candidatus Acidiferrales bacterium]
SNRYPDGGSHYLREKLAARYRLPMPQVFVGLGSSELIDLIARALLGPGLEGLTAERSYPPYAISIGATGARLVTAPLCGYAYDLDAIAAAITANTRVIYLANPNNPTGTYFRADAFEAFLSRVPDHALVVLDEAYCDYVEDKEYTRATDLVRAGRHNLVVLRTFSKVYGLAGLRVGYGLGPADLFEELSKLKTPFNTAGIGQAAAMAALDDSEHVRRSIERNRAGRAQIENGLAAAGMSFVPSATNFVFVEAGGDGDALAHQLLLAGVIVRPMRWMGFPEAFRVSVGTREENEKFLDVLARVRERAKPAAVHEVQSRSDAREP